MKGSAWLNAYSKCRMRSMASKADEAGWQRNILLPSSGQSLHTLVVAGQTVNPGFNKHQPELGALVLAGLLQVLAHAHGLLDQMVQILRDRRGKTIVLQDTEHLATCDREMPRRGHNRSNNYETGHAKQVIGTSCQTDVRHTVVLEDG